MRIKQSFGIKRTFKIWRSLGTAPRLFKKNQGKIFWKKKQKLRKERIKRNTRRSDEREQEEEIKKQK